MSLTFRVFGRPAPQGSKSRGRGGHMREASKYLAAWREVCSWTAAAEALQQGFQIIEKGALRLDVEFILPRPKYLKDRPAPADLAAKKPDRDKLLRAVCDAFSGILYRDDAQIVSGDTLKRVAEPGEESGAWIRVGPHSKSGIFCHHP